MVQSFIVRFFSDPYNIPAQSARLKRKHIPSGCRLKMMLLRRVRFHLPVTFKKRLCPAYGATGVILHRPDFFNRKALRRVHHFVEAECPLEKEKGRPAEIRNFGHLVEQGKAAPLI
ncbi:MAG: hypothetical protein PHH96_00425 [Smithellaceae bacterium]|jgi:hypothetical protein|nr:hypothetical protein [Smithellaceae bacterium]